MKSILTFALFIFCNLTVLSQGTNPKYDPALAKKYGSDDNGMKSYIMVILKTGSNKSTDKAFRDSCFAGHMKNIQHLVSTGKMVVAGPFGKNDNNYRGIFILTTTNRSEADSLLKADPTIREKIFDTEYYNWYGSAALPAYLDDADKIWK